MNEAISRLSLTDIARRAEVQVSAVSNWRKRHPDFPAPSIVSGQEMFEVPQVARWLQTRRIPQNRLKGGESPGATYGDRFLSNTEDFSIGAETNADRGTAPAATGWATKLWRAFDSLRGEHTGAAALEMLLGLVYVKTQRPDVWQALADPAEWRAALHKLPAVSLSLGAGDNDVPVFRDLPGDADPSVFETIRLIDEIAFGEGGGRESTSALVSETILAELERGMGRAAGRFTPPIVAQCLVGLLDLTCSDRVYDPFCGSGELLSAAAADIDARQRRLDGFKVSGQASHDWSLRTSAMNLALHGIDADLRKGNALEADRFADQRFSKIVANPPFNMRMDVPTDGPWPFGLPPAHNANFAWLQHVVAKLTPDGRGAVVMAGGAASTLSRSEAQIRAAMVGAGAVECVIALPARLFKFTAIPTMVWVLRGLENPTVREAVLFIDARHLVESADRGQHHLGANEIERITAEYRRWKDAASGPEFVGSEGFSRCVGYPEIEANDFVLTPGRYVLPTDETQDASETSAQLIALQDKLQQLRTVAVRAEATADTELSGLINGRRSGDDGRVVHLGSICDIVSGPGSIARSDPQPSWTPLVLPRNIRRGVIESEDIDAVPPRTAERLTRYQLHAGDIVSARAGTLGRFGLVHAGQTGWLLGPGCVMLRPIGNSSPEYLTYYLNGPTAQRWLMDRTSGSVIRHVNSKTLRELPVWLPSSESQDRIVEILKTFDGTAAVHRELSEASRQVHDLALAVLMSPDITPAPSGRPIA